MKKQYKYFLVCLILPAVIFSNISCSKAPAEQELTGQYHIEINGFKRGADLTVTLKKGEIYAVILDALSEYSITNPEAMQMMWPVKKTALILNLSDMSVEEIMAIEVKIDEQGIPSEVGIPEEWIPVGCTDCAGLVVLAMQNALENLE